MALAEWVTDFMVLARRFSLTTLDTYQRDLDRYIVPRFSSYRLGRMPADEIENWLRQHRRIDELVSTGSERIRQPAE